MKKEDFYEEPKRNFKDLRIICRVIFVIIAIIAMILIFSCEKYDSEGCCWVCRISNTKYYPNQQPNKVKIWLEYDKLFCDWPDSLIHEWEQHNTWSDTLNGVWTEQIATCVKGVQ